MHLRQDILNELFGLHTHCTAWHGTSCLASASRHAFWAGATFEQGRRKEEPRHFPGGGLASIPS